MTKKELLESSAFKAMPDDAEFVFATSTHLNECVKVRLDQINLMKEIVNDNAMQDVPFSLRDSWQYNPRYMVAAVIDAIPNDYMERYGIILKAE
jgi:hypothetical protein